MKQSRTQVFFLPSERSVTRAFQTGVSLHSHTEHSQEKLDDLPRYLDRMPVVSQFLRWERKRYFAATGAQSGFLARLLERPAERPIRLRPRASANRAAGTARAGFADRPRHDRCGLVAAGGAPGRGNSHIRGMDCAVRANVFSYGRPQSGPVAGHLVHAGVRALYAQTANLRTGTTSGSPGSRSLRPRRAESPAVGHGRRWPGAIDRAVTAIPARLRAAYSCFGNQRTSLLAGEYVRRQPGWGIWIPGGGRRRPPRTGTQCGHQPHARENFAEFAGEIRAERSSDIAVLPQYQEPLAFRHLLCAWDAVREHPEFAGRQSWVARVFVVCDDGVERPLSALWTKGTPGWIDPCLNVIGVLASPPVRTAARLAYQAAGSVAP